MNLEYYASLLEIKAVDDSARTIDCHVAVFSNVDRTSDIIDTKAFTRTLQEKKAADVGVFIAHNMAALPVGIPILIKPDTKGLFTQTKIFKTSAGDDLLQTARELMEAGQALGASIGYKTRDARFEQVEGKTVRRLLDIDLIEYSFAPSQSIANPEALVTAVKTAFKAMSEGTDTAGGFVAGGKKKADSGMDAAERNALDDSDFAWIDADGGRHLPINDAGHVRAAMARFGQTKFDSDTAKSKAWKKILAAAKKFDIEVADDSEPKATSRGIELKIGAVSMEQVAREVAQRAKEQLDSADLDDDEEQDRARNWCYPVATYPTSVVVCYSDQDGDDDDGEYWYDVPYSLDPTGHVASIGMPSTVEQTWVHAPMVKTHDFASLLRFAESAEKKAGSTMSATHKGMLHDALDSLRKFHDTQCKDPNCVHKMPDNADEASAEGGAGTGSGMGDGTDEGAGDSKTIDWYRRQFADLNKAAAIRGGS